MKPNPTTQARLIGPLYQGKPPRQKRNEQLIFVDGGVKFRTTQDLGIAVGDGDSCAQNQRNKLDLLWPQQKDFSDLAGALKLVSKKVKQVDLDGFLGKRLDHQLCNFGEVQKFLKRKKQVTVNFEHSVIFFSKGKYEIQGHGVFSVLVIEPARVRLTGACDYPLKQFTCLKPLSSLGLSNIISGQVTIECKAPCLVVFNELPRKPQCTNV